MKSTDINSHKLGYCNTGFSFHSISFTIDKLSQNALASHIRTIDLLTWHFYNNNKNITILHCKKIVVVISFFYVLYCDFFPCSPDE